MKRIIDKAKFGPWAIITGASSGIGEGFARQLASDGLNVVLVARRIKLLEEIGSGLAKEFGVKYRVIEADLSAEKAIKQVTTAVSDLDIGLLISNAGTGKVSKFLAMDEEEHRGFVQLNALSHLSLAHYFGRKFLQRGKGGILLSGAMGATEGVPYMASMSGSKSFVLSLGRSIHFEFQNTGIHITILEITPTDTAIIPKLGFQKDKMPMKPLSVEQCVHEGLMALVDNRPSILPGRMYRIMNSLVSSSVKRNMAGKLFKKNNNIE